MKALAKEAMDYLMAHGDAYSCWGFENTCLSGILKDIFLYLMFEQDDV